MANEPFHVVQYRARVTRRRTISDRGRSFVELTFALVGRHNEGQLVTGKFWSPVLVQRARSLHENQLVDIDVTTAVSRRGKRFPMVKDFRSTDQPSVVMFVGGVCTSDPANPRMVPHDYAPAAVCTSLDLKELEEQRAALREMGIEPHPLPLLDVKTLAALNAKIARMPVGPLADGPVHDPTAYLEEYQWSIFEDGGKSGEQRLVPADETFCRYAAADSGLHLEQPACLSSFRYGEDARLYSRAHNGLVAGYRGITWARWNVVALDGRIALADAIVPVRRLVIALGRLGIPEGQIMVFYAPPHGFHVMFPAAVAGTIPQTNYEYATGQFCQVLVDQAVLMLGTPADFADPRYEDAAWHEAIDWDLYKPNAMLQAPNTRHEGNGLFKVRLDHDELMSLDAEAIQALATAPRPFEVGIQAGGLPQTTDVLLSDLWRYAVAVAGSRAFAVEQVVDRGNWVFADTFDYMHNGAPEQTRVPRLFRAALNLLQVGCPRTAVYQLLSPAALMSGLAPAEVARQLEGAIRFMQRPRAVTVAPGFENRVAQPPEDALFKEHK